MNMNFKNDKSYKPYKAYNKNYKSKKDDYDICKKFTYSKDEVNLKQMVFLMIIIMNL